MTQTIPERCRFIRSLWSWRNAVSPYNYVVLDCETSGVSAEDVPLSIGIVVVERGMIVQTQERIINWIREPVDGVSVDWLRQRYDLTSQQLQKYNKRLGVSWDSMERSIHGPYEVAVWLSRWYAWASQDDNYLIGHNLVRFDEPLLDRFVRRLGGTLSMVPGNRVIDTAGCEKFCVLMANRHYSWSQYTLYPHSSETLRQYWRRLLYYRAPGVQYRLERCVELYLPDFPKEQLHNALADALAVHQLVRLWWPQ